MTLSDVFLDLAYFFLAVAGDAVLFLAAALVAGALLDGLVSAVGVMRR